MQAQMHIFICMCYHCPNRLGLLLQTVITQHCSLIQYINITVFVCSIFYWKLTQQPMIDTLSSLIQQYALVKNVAYWHTSSLRLIKLERPTKIRSLQEDEFVFSFFLYPVSFRRSLDQIVLFHLEICYSSALQEINQIKS